MEYKYQIVLTGTITSATTEITELFYKKLEELQLLSNAYKTINASDFDKEYKGNQPTFVLYFGNSEGNFEDANLVEKLLKDGNIVLPIFYNSFREEIPPILSNQNGLQYSNDKNDTIVNLILESFGKLRNSRKVFISYKRDESTSVAIQLYEALEKYNFDVFLDTHSIKPGEPFQDELWHRMTDCDVIVILNTPKFLESNWCKEEIAEANVKQIGVVQLIWPNHILERIAEVCFPINLNENNFINKVYNNKDTSKLTNETVSSIVQQVESVRARNLASRQDNLITEFLNIARTYGKGMNIQPERFITEKLDNKKRRIFIPTVGIPQSIDCDPSSALMKEIDDFSVNEVYLIYDDIRIKEKWLNHLDYLNNHLDVKTIKKQKFDEWLQNH
ncbi:toll/interleukin-1 receptor domain-containing protein [Cytophagaceae bacterium DM2B3-1]|uniref:Toll/interleukin-1 receptor domain-containing protein n=1 Tax=Xanthocytophaga flava TaxID=3048013 RepID=A0ABT7CXB0_9BACT|nr:toll/interleukin-1 receptor domain-containing protein [Xanthocytophaga flavus]MDJ1498409.1 toll/interleukin-1 receptor domain-containing protein [Xanthocytophaga flavus]